ncbi:MAG: cupin domain-containing protein [Beijerinckiaceae bacterium]|nr:cupin domain-containing protein [Beijerinckiaceae bacterium]MCZ8301699.1 cupin domain-containing protein [Beijerinckiaceae bacterium]
MTKTLIHLGRDGQPLATGRAGAASAADPFAAGRQILFDDGSGHRAGHLVLSGAVPVGGLGHAELMTVGAGRLVVDGRSHDAGAAVVLPRGFSGMVEAAPGTLVFFVAQEMAEAPAGETGAITLDPALPRNRSAGPAAEVLVSAPPECHSLNLFTDASGLRAGIWDVSTPCERRFVPHRIHELMHLLEGEVTLTHQSEGAARFRAGDVIFVPQGAPYAWKNERKVVKYYTVSG